MGQDPGQAHKGQEHIQVHRVRKDHSEGGYL
jgi:hypothetical protein